jgi:hypothetical protein
VRTFTCLWLMALLFCLSELAFAQLTEKEPAAVLEIGGAASRSITESQSSFGPTVAVEVTPIENWLELEAGVTPLFRRHSTEWSADLLFKKLGRCRTRRKSCLELAPNGFTRTHTEEN